MKLLFGTTNEAKIKKYVEKLQQKNIEIYTLKDINIHIDINENGKDAIENAKIKAKSYYDETRITTIGMDNNLYIDGLSDENQPGTHVRRVSNRELNDDEMIEHYIDLVNKYGIENTEKNRKELTAKWIYGMSVYNGTEFKNYMWSKDDFLLVNKSCSKRNKGYPLDSISIDKKIDKYFVEIDESEKIKSKDTSTECVIDFLVNCF